MSKSKTARRAASVPADPNQVDPIFAAIEAHKALVAEWRGLLKISGRLMPKDAGYHDATEATATALGVAIDAQLVLMGTKPTTVAGVAALLRYVASFWVEGNDSYDRGTAVYETLADDDLLDAGERFLPMIADAIERVASTA
jgi:hypothetical protein